MSGHSKWHNIQVRKGAQDKKRATVFTKLAKAITVAAKEGGADLNINFNLRLAVDRAKQANMPKDNIERAISRGAGGGGGENLVEVIYEGKGPGNIDIIVETLTDNKNRTASEIKSIFTKNGGQAVAPGSASWNFQQRGYIKLKPGEKLASSEVERTKEEAMLEIMDLNIEDIEETNGILNVYTKPKELEKTRKEIEEKEYKIEEAELILDPKNTLKLEAEESKKALKLLEALDDYEDTQNVYTNME